MTDESTIDGVREYLSRQVVVASENGLHARPAGRLAQEAQAFEADISLVCGDQKVDAKSILDILTLAAGPGHVVELRAMGEDAEAALERLEKLFQNKFEGA
ncbi:MULTISPECIES: HPr family phosphocarrier protein [unclassified Pseudodesulfovibrio]|uniref:HPr family phosphocarrier protein n=1 Tax=unclassified Pseudodesulfovibrio TaxID=2661612 RepID=UPI000FEBF6BC|nr:MULTISPECIES: HPr family phosphocarrier protein [unclassified Pseudodesulfovibrio]MCJ2166141.1 HPr family phosphocarrier protein [Pseudodesulfovibrio sp. S3-i]RWU02374.1 HPr family phosphocarrier protein [Pseudodesulfovibrio sp. S3]